MNKDELLQALRELAESKDPEEAHGKTDELLVSYIGDEEIREAFKSIKKWYA